MDEPIRVLQVLGAMNRGGAENMIMNLYREIDRDKVQFDFVVHTDKECSFNEEIRSLGGKIFSAPKYTIKNHFAYKKWWKKFLKSHPEYRVIHGHMYSIASIYLGIAKKYGLVTIAHSHSTSEGKGVVAVVKKIIRAPLKNIADYLFACSDKAGEWLYGKKFLKKENYILLKNAIDTKKFLYNEKTEERIRKEFGLDGKFVLVHVGRFSPPKNHSFLLDIFAEIYKKDKNCRLLLVGDGGLRPQIEAQVKKLNIAEGVVLTGIREDVHEVLQAADCFVFPSLYEGLPVTVVEAQAAGLPCFISDTITDEVCATELVCQLPINCGTTIWEKALLGISNGTAHKDVIKDIIEAGYDIKTTTQWLMQFYVEKWKK